MEDVPVLLYRMVFSADLSVEAYWTPCCCINMATYLLYGVHVVNDFATCIVVPIMYLLVFALLVSSEVWVVVCALRALNNKSISGYTCNRMQNPTIKLNFRVLHPVARNINCKQ
jgi:hypothetical protein